MKLTEDQIVDLLQSPEPLVRQAACDYFAQAFRDHPRLFDEIRAAAEKYGGDELFAYWDWFSHLIVPDQHWPWVVKHAEVEDSAFGDACRFLLLAQDTAALKKHEALWRGNENLGLGEDTEAWLKQRLELLEGTAEDAWKQLESWAEDRLKLPLDERWDETWAADAMTEAVRRGTSDELRERVRAIVLAGENDPEQVDYYLIPWAIRLAGEWRLEDTADAIFRYDRSATHPAIYQEASDALAKIGGESALRALTAGWADWDRGERTLAALHLVNQRGPAAIEAALQLAAEMAENPEEAGDILQLLGDCILVHFDQEAGERLIAALPTDEATEPCAKGLIIWALGLGLEHPERERWPRLVEARLEKVGQHEHHECGPGCDHDHDHGDGHSHEHAHSHSHEHHHCGPGCDHDHGPAHAEEDESEIDHDSQTVRKDQGRVGRNDPCPCGSGKKYKKCCLNVAATTDLVDFDF